MAICNWRMFVSSCTIEKYLEYRPFSSYGHIHMRFRRHGQCNSSFHFLNKPDTVRIPTFFTKRIFSSLRPMSRLPLISPWYTLHSTVRSTGRTILMTDFWTNFFKLFVSCKNFQRILLKRIFNVKIQRFLLSLNFSTSTNNYWFSFSRRI